MGELSPKEPKEKSLNIGESSPRPFEVDRSQSEEYTSLEAPQSPELSTDRFRFSHSDSIDDGASSIASASDLRDHTERSTSLQFFGAEGVLNPPTVVPLTHAIDVSEQVCCIEIYNIAKLHNQHN